MSTTVVRQVAAGLCAIGVVGAITLGASFHPTSPNPTQEKPVDPAQPLYRLHCQVCHGVGGKAPLPEMAFFEREWKHGTSSAAIAKVITEGIKGTPMLSFQKKLSPDEIMALARLVRSFDPRLEPEKR